MSLFYLTILFRSLRTRISPSAVPIATPNIGCLSTKPSTNPISRAPAKYKREALFINIFRIDYYELDQISQKTSNKFNAPAFCN